MQQTAIWAPLIGDEVKNVSEGFIEEEVGKVSDQQICHHFLPRGVKEGKRKKKSIFRLLSWSGLNLFCLFRKKPADDKVVVTGYHPPTPPPNALSVPGQIVTFIHGHSLQN